MEIDKKMPRTDCKGVKSVTIPLRDFKKAIDFSKPKFVETEKINEKMEYGEM